MRVHVYAPTFNEEKILPYFLRHYSTFAERLIFIDNGSTDRSREIISAAPSAVLKSLDTNNKMEESALRDIRNHAWKESRGQADFVVIADADEFVWHPNMRGYLEELKRIGVTLCQ